MKYLKLFQTQEEYDAFYTENTLTPICTYNKETSEVAFNDIYPKDSPLYIEALEDLTASFTVNQIEYSLDNATWVALPAATSTPTVLSGEKIYFRASGITPATSGMGIFSTTGKCNVGGNIMSMQDGANFLNSVAISGNARFRNLFKNAINIQDASKLVLPATSLTEACYMDMFNGCTSLVKGPSILPALSVIKQCYCQMFQGCTSLVKGPSILPATDMAYACYANMFRNCTGLKFAPKINATKLYDQCFTAMFSGCESLEKAPALHALKLEYQSYQSIFWGCSNLKYIKAMFTTTPSSSYNQNWVNGVAATGTFVKNAAATWDVTGVNGIPEGWTVETAEA